MSVELVTVRRDVLRQLTKIETVAEQVVRYPQDGYWRRRLAEVVEESERPWEVMAPDSPA